MSLPLSTRLTTKANGPSSGEEQPGPPSSTIPPRRGSRPSSEPKAGPSRSAPTLGITTAVSPPNSWPNPERSKTVIRSVQSPHVHVLPRTVEEPLGEHGLDLSEFGASRFANRELSWLDFGERLLELAEDSSMPVLERVKFIAIFSEALDEFFQVRVAGLKDQVDAGLRTRSSDGLRPSEALGAIKVRVDALVERQSAIFLDQIVPTLADAGVRLSDWASLDDDDRDVPGGGLPAPDLPGADPAGGRPRVTRSPTSRTCRSTCCSGWAIP